MRNKKYLVLPVFLLAVLVIMLAGVLEGRDGKTATIRNLVPRSSIKKETEVNSTQEAELKKKIEIIVRTHLVNDKSVKFNGTLLVAKDGREIYNYASGYANFEKKKLVSENTSFNLASLSKQFTAMAVMILYEQGKVNLEDSITKYLPEIAYKKITVKHLLTHTSGIMDYFSLVSGHLGVDSIVTNEDILNLFSSYKPSTRFIPGSTWEYSNTGYVFLAAIVERVSGKSFETFLDESIFKPLGMENSLVYRLSKNTPIENRAFGYQYKYGKYILDDLGNIDGVVGDGNVYSSTKDLLKWDNALRTEKLVKHSTLDRIFSQDTLASGKLTNYGFGWFIENTKSGKAAWHTGGWVGFRSFILRNLSSNYTFIFLSNVPDDGAWSAAVDMGNIIRDGT